MTHRFCPGLWTQAHAAYGAVRRKRGMNSVMCPQLFNVLI